MLFNGLWILRRHLVGDERDSIPVSFWFVAMSIPGRSAIYFAPVSYRENGNDAHLIVNSIQSPVVADPEAVFFAIAKLLHAPGSGIAFQ